jgi:hypothetical protein
MGDCLNPMQAISRDRFGTCDGTIQAVSRRSRKRYTRPRYWMADADAEKAVATRCLGWAVVGIRV